MTKRVLAMCVCAALVSGALSVASPAKAEVCADRKARQTLELRVLQSELMVAALTCNQRAGYNAFVTTFKPFLKDQGASLRAFFSAQYGPSAGPARMNRMVTRLANTASQRSIRQSTQAFCEKAKARFNTVLSADVQNVLRMARSSPTADDHGFRSCVEVANSK